MQLKLCPKCKKVIEAPNKYCNRCQKIVEKEIEEKNKEE